MISQAHLKTILDDWAASYRTADLTAVKARMQATGVDIYGDGSTVYGTGDLNFISEVGKANVAGANRADPDVVNSSIFGGVYGTLNAYLADNGFTTLDAYLLSLNTAAPYTLLVDWRTAAGYALAQGKKFSLFLSPQNVFPPVTHLGTGGISGGAVIFTPGATIPTANASPSTQGYAPAKGANVTITTLIVGTVVLTVTANGWDSTGAPVTGRVWTATISNDTVGVSIPLAPAHAGDRISQITNIVENAGGSGTAGIFSVDSIPDRAVT